MARAGRKRKAIEREPNGRADRKQSDVRYSPAAIKRLADSAIASAHDPRLGTVLGRMLLSGDITSRQAGAGWQWSEIAFDYLQAIGATPLQVKSATLDRGARSEAPDIDSPAGELISERDKRAVKRYERAILVIQSQGLAAEKACRMLCEGRGIAPSTYEARVSALRCLDALASHFAAI